MNTSPPKAEYLPIDKLRPFEGHPFQVKDDDEMDQLVFSVLTQGLLTPITVRATDTDEYEVISGHRRLRACQKAGIKTIPALIYSMDRDAAVIAPGPPKTAACLPGSAHRAMLLLVLWKRSLPLPSPGLL